MASHTSTRAARRRFLQVVGGSSLATLVLAACGTTPEASTPTSAPAESAPTNAPAASAPTNAPAENGNTNQLDQVALTYVYTTFGPAAVDLPKVQNTLSALLTSKINATLTLEAIDNSGYNDQINLKNSGGEAFDAVFTAPWTNSYTSNVQNGTLLPLDELLPRYAPKLWASMPETTWNAARIGGKIYGVINQQKFPKTEGIILRKDIADKYAIDLSSIKSYTDMTTVMQTIKDGEKDAIRYVFAGYGPTEPTIWGYDTAGHSTAVVKLSDTSAKAVSWFATPEFKQLATLFKTWRDAGFFPSENLAGEEVDALINAGQVPLILVSPIGPTSASGTKSKFSSYDWVAHQIAPAVLNTGGVVATLTGIPVTSKHPERAMMFLELLNTEPEVYNLLVHGIQGEHWEWKDEAKKLIATKGDTFDQSGLDWEFGNVFNGYYTDEGQIGRYEEEQKVNNSATPSPIIGWAFDPKPVEAQIKSVDAIITESLAGLYNGTVEIDPAISDLNAKIKEAGSDAILAEVQRQIDAWKAA